MVIGLHGAILGCVKPQGIGEWTIVHSCSGCGLLRTNRVAGDDDEVTLFLLALRPMNYPAFPIETLRPEFGGEHH